MNLLAVVKIVEVTAVAVPVARAQEGKFVYLDSAANSLKRVCCVSVPSHPLILVRPNLREHPLGSKGYQLPSPQFEARRPGESRLRTTFRSLQNNPSPALFTVPFKIREQATAGCVFYKLGTVAAKSLRSVYTKFPGASCWCSG